jgi:hypothetical protein
VAVRVGLILSVIVVVAAFVYAGRESRYPDLAWIDDFLALVVGGAALALIWLGVFVATLLGRPSEKKPEAP